MAGFQNTLQGGQATASVNPKTTDTSGIDLATSLVGLAGKTIGSSYAEAKASTGYENAFQQARRATAGLGTVEDRLREVTTQVSQNSTPELQGEMSQLEEVIRKAKMGKAQGVLSGLAFKSRIDAAYKQSLANFPAFASELKAHRDSAVSGGAMGALLAKTEFEKEEAERQTKAINDDMIKYGLSPDNEIHRTTYLTEARQLGIAKMNADRYAQSVRISDHQRKVNNEVEDQIMQRETHLQNEIKFLQGQEKYKHYTQDRLRKLAQDKIDERRKAESHASAQEGANQRNTRFNQEQDGRPAELEADRLAAQYKANQERRSAQNHIITLRKEQHRLKMLPTKTAIEEKRLEEIKLDIKRSEQTIANNNIVQPIKQAQLQQEHSTDANVRNARISFGKFQSQEFSKNYAELLGAVQSPDFNVADAESSIATKEGLMLAAVNSRMSEIGQSGTPAHTSLQKQVREHANDLRALVKSQDPLAIAENRNKFLQVSHELGLQDDERFKKYRYLKSVGLTSAMNTYNQLLINAAKELPGSHAYKTLNNAAEEYYKRTGLSLLDTSDEADHGRNLDDFANSVKNGTPATPLSQMMAAMTLKTEGGKNLNTDTEDGEPLMEIAWNSKHFGYQALVSDGSIAAAGATPKGKEMYNNAVLNHFKQTAALLPDGYKLHYTDDNWSISKKSSEGSYEVVSTLNKNPKTVGGGLFSGKVAVDLWTGGTPWDSIGMDTSTFNGQVNHLNSITTKAKHLITDKLEADNGGNQNKNFIGTTVDVIGAGVDYVVGAEDANAGEVAQSGQGFLGHVGSRDKEYIEAWEARGKEYLPLYEEAGKAHGVPVDILIRQGAQESLFKNEAESPKAAVGVSQFIPSTAKAYGLIDEDGTDHRTDPAKSIDAQARFMAELLERNDGDLATALVEYNGGGKMREAWKAGKIKLKGTNYKETRGYILGILGESAFKE